MKLFSIFFFLFLIIQPAFSQDPNMESLMDIAYSNKFSPDERVKALHEVAIILNNTNPDSAFQVLNAATALLENMNDEELKAKNHLLKATVLQHTGNYPQALEEAHFALKIATAAADSADIADCYNNIGQIYEHQGDYNKALIYHSDALRINYKINEPSRIAKSMSLLGNIYASLFQYDKAIDIYEESMLYIDTVNNRLQLGIALGNIGFVYYEKGIEYENRGQVDSAFNVLYPLSINITQKAIDIFEGLQSRRYSIIGYLNKGLAYNRLRNYSVSEKLCMQALDLATQMKLPPLIRDACECMYLSKKGSGAYPEALKFYENFVHLRDSLVNKDRERLMVEKELGFNYEKEQLADSLEHEQEQAAKEYHIQNQRIGLFAVAGILILLGVLVLVVFRGKKRSDELLLNILPYETAMELKKKGSAEAKQFEHVTVLFTDFKGFTTFAEKLSPKELVAEIDQCFKGIDHIMEKHNIEKIKTIGDAYMAVGGLPVSNTSNAIDVLKAAFDILTFMNKLRAEKEATGKPFFEIRIGIHSGPVIAGIVGVRKFAYDIWGDTVNVASRMESNSEAGKINISGDTYALVKNLCVCTYRGKIEAKGKGEIDMYFVESLKDLPPGGKFNFLQFL